MIETQLSTVREENEKLRSDFTAKIEELQVTQIKLS